MDNETYLKELAKHLQRNTPNTKREDSDKNKIQIKTFKTEGEFEKLMSSTETDSLELYYQMMAAQLFLNLLSRLNLHLLYLSKLT